MVIVFLTAFHATIIVHYTKYGRKWWMGAIFEILQTEENLSNIILATYIHTDQYVTLVPLSVALSLIYSTSFFTDLFTPKLKWHITLMMFMMFQTRDFCLHKRRSICFFLTIKQKWFGLSLKLGIHLAFDDLE